MANKGERWRGTAGAAQLYDLAGHDIAADRGERAFLEAVIFGNSRGCSAGRARRINNLARSKLWHGGTVRGRGQEHNAAELFPLVWKSLI